MPRGDQLAAGAKQATFQQANSHSELENDLKIHLASYVKQKYGINQADYSALIDVLKRGGELPPLVPIPPVEITVITEPGLQPVAEEVFDPGPVPAEEASKVGYRGRARGDHIIIQRVEREHTSNLIIPDSMKAKSDIGFIYSAGEKCETYRQGMLVLFDRFASHGADIDLIDEEGIERKLLLLREYDVQCELEKVTLSPGNLDPLAP